MATPLPSVFHAANAYILNMIAETDGTHVALYDPATEEETKAQLSTLDVAREYTSSWA